MEEISWKGTNQLGGQRIRSGGRGPSEGRRRAHAPALVAARASPSIRSAAPQEHGALPPGFPPGFPRLLLLSLTVAQTQRELCSQQKRVISHSPRAAEAGTHLCRPSSPARVR